MRDIRPDLRERLAMIARERARLDQMEAGIKVLLQQEDQQHQAFSVFDNADVVMIATEPGTPLTRAIRAALAKRALSIDELKTAVKDVGYDFGKRSPGRVLHWGLVGMGSAVEKKGDKWQLMEVTQ